MISSVEPCCFILRHDCQTGVVESKSGKSLIFGIAILKVWQCLSEIGLAAMTQSTGTHYGLVRSLYSIFDHTERSSSTLARSTIASIHRLIDSDPEDYRRATGSLILELGTRQVAATGQCALRPVKDAGRVRQSTLSDCSAHFLDYYTSSSMPYWCRSARARKSRNRAANRLGLFCQSCKF